jgi:ribosomal protein S18 acetylase RimI-like enzyme
MTAIRILDVTDDAGFGRIPPCVDPGFDHRTCDYWEDERRGSKAARLSWLEATPAPASRPTLAGNPFAPPDRGPAFNPFAPKAARPTTPNLFDPLADDEEPSDNPFAPKRDRGPALPSDAPRKLQLLARGKAVFGSYAKVLEADGAPAAYCQFGPLSAYPRAQRVRDLYPKLPSAPLPAVITCIATTAAARGQGLAQTLVGAVVDDLASRGFSAVEAYPEPEARPDATSAANPAFWRACGFELAIDDDRFPVVRREL